jgi:hypothetical protein
MITKGYIFLKKRYSHRQSFLVPCQFRARVLASLLTLLLIRTAFGQNRPPEITRFQGGDNVMIIGIVMTKIDLTRLGVAAFDNKTIDRPVYTPEEGWVHYIMNPGWQGVLVVWEIQGEINKFSKLRSTLFSTNDGSPVVPLTAVDDESGAFAVASERGVCVKI